MHGHAPRVRRRYNQQSDEEQTVLSIDGERVLNNIFTSAVGAVVGAAVTRAIYKDE